ncbi:hypothetical protein Mboo_1483 [Methanoregula boonei 6A8]|uniref:Uncharacterized protein n=1 Tax=Methanoregula boonei (strain DSM 21154 / JCM 14090 / 6A8) TaxID=456442 RepID=A7I8E0_METB6|nr:hypothetical protein Mboo_1483 [Methanoregula boonei 6A8]
MYWPQVIRNGVLVSRSKGVTMSGFIIFMKVFRESGTGSLIYPACSVTERAAIAATTVLIICLILKTFFKCLKRNSRIAIFGTYKRLSIAGYYFHFFNRIK